MKENRGAVLCAKVWSLAVHLRRVVNLPESFEQLFVSHFRRIKRYLHHFRMSRFIRANILISRIRHLTAAVTYCGIDYSRDALKRGFNAPETPRSKSRYLCHGNHLFRQTPVTFYAYHLDARAMACDPLAPLGCLLPRRRRSRAGF